MAMSEFRLMRISVDIRKQTARFQSCRIGAGFCLLLLAGCGYDLSLPAPPPEVSDTVRVTVTVTRSDLAKVSVRGQQTLDENGIPATVGVIPEDEKTLQQVPLGQLRSVEFDFPVDSTTLIKSGMWDFFISMKSVVPTGGDENPWQTKCTTNLRKGGVNSLEAIENTATCTGDFVVFTGQHEVGIGEVKVEPDSLRVGDKASIKFIAMNNGANSESPFSVTIKATDSAGLVVTSQVVLVPALPSGAEQVIPAPTDPPITWNTTSLRPGTYIVEAGLTSPIPGDPQPTNDRNSAIVELAAGDFDGDGVADDVDNCPTVANPKQENCDSTDPEGKLGNACKTPKIKGVVPNTCNISGGDTVTVTGFGFANIQPGDIEIGQVKADRITNQSACTVQFTNPPTNSNPTGLLRIRTMPPVQIPLCCQAPTINLFSPTTGAPGATLGQPGTEIFVLGCGFTGVTAMLSKYPGGIPQYSLPSAAPGPTGQLLTFQIPFGVPIGNYWIELRQGTTDVKSQDLLVVQP
jgi:Thrombospondin type 3 repeat/IPT/TIG domain